ncbi:MAG: hypothetical protein AAF416_02435 [Pseudomonadota bacterium]
MSEAGARLERLLDEADALLAEERALCLSGALSGAAALAERKTALVEGLAEALAAARGTLDQDLADRLRGRVTTLSEAARANEALLQAARAGLKRAARELARVEKMRRGAVAYAADGGSILSREDAAGRSKRA